MSSCLEKLELAFFAAFRAGIILLFKGLLSVFILPLDGMCTTRHHLTPRYLEAPVVRRVQEYKNVQQNPKSRLQTASPVAAVLDDSRRMGRECGKGIAGGERSGTSGHKNVICDPEGSPQRRTEAKQVKLKVELHGCFVCIGTHLTF